jgi:hypothetical protein
MSQQQANQQDDDHWDNQNGKYMLFIYISLHSVDENQGINPN